MYLDTVAFHQPLTFKTKGTELPFFDVRWTFRHEGRLVFIETENGFSEWSSSLTMQLRIFLEGKHALIYDSYEPLKKYKRIKNRTVTRKWSFFPDKNDLRKKALSWTLDKGIAMHQIRFQKLDSFVSPCVLDCLYVLLGSVTQRKESFYVHPVPHISGKVNFVQITSQELLVVQKDKESTKSLPDHGVISWQILDASRPNDVHEVTTRKNLQTRTIEFQYKAHTHGHDGRHHQDHKEIRWVMDMTNRHEKAPNLALETCVKLLRRHWNWNSNLYIVDPVRIPRPGSQDPTTDLKDPKDFKDPMDLMDRTFRTNKSTIKNKRFSPDKGLKWIRNIKNHFDKLNALNHRHVLPPNIDPKWFCLRKVEEEKLRALRVWSGQAHKLPAEGNWFARVLHACMQAYGLGGKQKIKRAAAQFRCWQSDAIGISLDEDYSDLCRKLYLEFFLSDFLHS